MRLRARAAGLRRSALGASDADPGGSAAAGGGYPGGDISAARPAVALDEPRGVTAMASHSTGPQNASG
jgi:hypothetical protein